LTIPEPGPEAVDGDRPHVEAPPSPAGTPLAAVSGGEFVAGQRWHGLVFISPATGGSGQGFLADNVSTMERVIVHARPLTDDLEWRRGAWERLVRLQDRAIVPSLDVYEEDGWRYEISAAPTGATLREWISCHKAGPRESEAIVRQLATVLHALHREGVVHLNLRPETIFVEETQAGLTFTLGGLHSATLYTQPRLTPAEVDPFYAPPEAAGLTVHQPGTRLCAWDWWSLGRVVQECILGGHILGLVLHRDVSARTPELRQRAEQLLLERAPPGIRAGAVEEMPDLDGTTQTLLRGLLSSSCEARWGSEAVQRWLRREPVKDYYELPRAARLWSWRGRPFTVPEAAAHFTQDAAWEEGEANLFNADDPESLAYFLQDDRSHRPEWQRLQSVLEMAELPAWAHVPAAARRPAIAAAAWLTLAATGGPAQLCVRGRTIDVTGLCQLLTAPGVMEAAAMVDALLAPPFVHFIETFDPTAARVLTTLAAVGGAAARMARENGWLDPQEGGEHTRLLLLALQPVAALRKRAEQVRSRYAVNRHPLLARLLAQPTHASSELVVLVFTGEAAGGCGYITHEEWTRERLEELRGRAGQAVRALFWLRLKQSLQLGRPIGEAWPVFAGVALGVAAVAGGALRSFSAAAGVLVAMLAARVWLTWWVRQMLRTCEPAVAPWTWRDDRRRCDAELVRFPEERTQSAAAIELRLHGLKVEMARLAGGAHAAPRVAEPLWWELWAGLGVTIIFALFSLLPALIAPEDPEPALMRLPAPAAGTPAAKAAVEPRFDPALLLASGDYEIVDDGFGRGLRGPLKRWDFRPPAEPPPLDVLQRAPASPEQAAFALVAGSLLLRPYPRRAVNVLLAVSVPTTRGCGVMIFNTQDRRLVSREVLLLRQPPAEREWRLFEGKRILHLGVPPALRPEISLAPP
jgi:hypothetical protein